MVGQINRYLLSKEGFHKVAELFPELVDNGVDLTKSAGLDNVAQAVYSLGSRAYVNRKNNELIKSAVLRSKELRDGN